jgi:hypothetical protein
MRPLTNKPVNSRNLVPISLFKTMTVQTRQHRIATRPRIGRRLKRTARKPAQAAVARVAAEQPEARERLSGGPEDRALYHCHCGFVFEDAVTTSVGCPHCGCAQAW